MEMNTPVTNLILRGKISKINFKKMGLKKNFQKLLFKMKIAKKKSSHQNLK